MVAQETLDSGPAYVLKVVPKTANKYLIDGRSGSMRRTTPSFVLKVSRHTTLHSGSVAFISNTPTKEWVSSGLPGRHVATASYESLETQY